MTVRVQFVGSGDAFGSGGRFQACISVQSETFHLLLDLGATSLTALRQARIDPRDVDAIAITHLHGDHYGGLPFFILDAQFRRGTKPLLIAGPTGLRERTAQALETSFPGSSTVERKFVTSYLELPTAVPTPIGTATVTAYEVPHPSGAPAFALRVEIDGRTIGYSGDGEWSESLVEAARDADLFIVESYSFEKPIRNHLSYATLKQQRSRLTCRRLILTHMGADMLEQLDTLEDEAAYDGLVVTL